MLFVDAIDGVGAAKVVGAVVIVGVDEGIVRDDLTTESFLSTPLSSLLSFTSVETLGVAESVPTAILLLSPIAVEVGVGVGAGAVAAAVV